MNIWLPKKFMTKAPIIFIKKFILEMIILSVGRSSLQAGYWPPLLGKGDDATQGSFGLLSLNDDFQMKLHHVEYEYKST